MKRYNPIEVEKKWRQIWDENETYKVDLNDDSRKKYYSFSMLPGITGAGIHIGHGRTYQFSDIKVRAKRQQGYNAYHPIGWDSFGLPVENYAIKVGKAPRVAHDEAKVHFKEQLKRLGFSYDWTKEISTADPEYYKWTQWIFLQMFKKGLAYKDEIRINWCPSCKIGLANEEVVGGHCERCGGEVEHREKSQWMLRITDYAERLLKDLDTVDYQERIKLQQINWIGRSEGAEIDFSLEACEDVLRVFTTRPDTLFGATYMVISPEHPYLEKYHDRIENMEEVHAYQKCAEKKSDFARR